MDVCQKCRGCGQVADTYDQEPWTAWATLPVQSAAAVIMGLVKPIPCPACAKSAIAGLPPPDPRDACIAALADALEQDALWIHRVHPLHTSPFQVCEYADCPARRALLATARGGAGELK